MSKFYHRPLKLVRSYKHVDNWLVIEVRDDLNVLRAFGSCSYISDYPQLEFVNVSLDEGLYFFELQRWLYCAQAYCRKLLDEVERFAEDTIFHWDEIDSLEPDNSSND